MRNLLLVLLLVAGCQKAAEPAKPQPAAVKAEAPKAVEGELKVELKPDGTIAFTAKDRWGASLDTTYESVTYLENAVPTLERALSPQQTEKLKAELTRIKAAKP